MKKRLSDFNPFFYKIISLNQKIEFIILNYKIIKLANSLNIEDIFLMYLFIIKKLSIENFLLNTGRLFLQSLILIKKIEKKYFFNIKKYYSNIFLVSKYIKKYTLNAFYNNVIFKKICCYIRKIEPLNLVLKNTNLWITGLRKEHSFNRKNIFEYEFDNVRNIIKCNLLLNWNFKDIFYFVEKFDLLINCFYNSGYFSIGCNPCTKVIYNNEYIRTGRWWWEYKNINKECGIHFNE